ncbi:FAD/NAD(P)-binding protein [Microbacterium radiodurans]|uniref:FAD/NAD(P)-binding protein n=2 Tax=Microbacterium radiodurans TaxID=661398 RepID=A0A5J5IVG8_9MICO|nr:FAD/NAD(P)-binding protein [Microbacterium radiodurans]
MLLERIVARFGADVVGDSGETDPRAVGAPRLHVELIDPHPPGAGRIWRRAQSPLLKLNSMARDVTVFTDDSCTIEGPIRPGPSLIEWAELWRSGELAASGRGIEIDDEVAAAEARGLRGDSFPTRRLHSYYLDWFFRRTVAEAPAGITVRWRADTVVGVTERADAAASGHTVTLASGLELDTDVVVYTVGHNGREPDAATADLVASAREEGLVYVPPAFTADADLSVLAAGEDVIVRGMGLAAVDLVVLLTQGRGGRFVADGERLRYAPSGREPRLHLGSRRGVPYRSKVSSVLQGEPPQREVLTSAAIAGLLARPRPVDFDTDVWPLIASEMLHGHYRELFTGHPDRVVGEWAAFRAVLQAHAWDDPALLAAIASAVPDPLDRFDIGTLDRPLAAEVFADGAEAHHRVVQHIETDLALRTTPERSASQGVFLAVLLSFLALSEIPTERWTARSRAVSLPVRWHTFFSYVASGPPAHRLEELLALADAGVVRFLGPETRVSVHAGRGFVASSPRVPGETVARSLVDAWLPGSGAVVSDNAALRQLAGRHGVELRVRDADFDGSLGRVHTDDDGRIVTADGAPAASLFALGPFTSLTEGGAFTRPAANALPLRQNDRTAGAVLAALAAPALASA